MSRVNLAAASATRVQPFVNIIIQIANITINKMKPIYSCAVSPVPAKIFEIVSINHPSKSAPFVRMCLLIEIFIDRVKTEEINRNVGSKVIFVVLLVYNTLRRIINAKSRFNPIRISTISIGSGITMEIKITIAKKAGKDDDNLSIIPLDFFINTSQKYIT